MGSNEVLINRNYVLFCLGHAPIHHTKKTITLLLATLLVIDQVPLTIAVIFGERNFIKYMIKISLKKY